MVEVPEASSSSDPMFIFSRKISVLGTNTYGNLAHVQFDSAKSNKSFRTESVNPAFDQVPIPKPPDGGYGWVVVFAAMMINFMIEGITFSFGVFLEEIAEHFGVSIGVASVAYSLQCGMAMFSGPVVGGLVNRFGAQSVTISGAILSAFGVFVSVFMHHFALFCLFYGLITGFGMGMMFLPSMVHVGFYFEKKRAIATSIASCGSGLGSALLAPFTVVLLECPESKIKTIFMKMVDLNLLLNPVMAVLIISNALTSLAIYIPFVYMVNRARDIGANASTASLLMTVMGISGIAGRLLFGWLADNKFTSTSVTAFCMLACGIVTAGAAFFKQLNLMLMYMVFFGLLQCTHWSLGSVVVADCFGLEKLTNGFGLVTLARGVIAAIASPIGGVIYQASDSYGVTFAYSGILFILSGVGFYLVPVVMKKYETSRKQMTNL